jgi:hydrogenase maturation protease
MSDGKTNKKTDKTLVLGIGNSSRGDDALGWKFLDFLRNSGFEGLDLEYRYQLQVEDAELISRYEKVIFVDATSEATQDGFYVRSCDLRELNDITSHSLGPETVNSLCRSVFDKAPECLIIGIEGRQWELGEGLSSIARDNLSKAQNFFIEQLFMYI